MYYLSIIDGQSEDDGNTHVKRDCGSSSQRRVLPGLRANRGDLIFDSFVNKRGVRGDGSDYTVTITRGNY